MGVGRGSDEEIHHSSSRLPARDSEVPSPVPAPTAIGYVTNFWVMPAERSQGVGAELLAAMRK